MKKLVFTMLLLFYVGELYSISISFPNNEVLYNKVNTQTTLEIFNEKDTFYAGEVNIYNRTHENGNEINTTANSNFIIIPSKLLLPPQEQVTITILYKGAPILEEEKAFRVLVSELSFTPNQVNSDVGRQLNLNVKVNYLNSFYIYPQNTNGDVQLISIFAKKSIDLNDPTIELKFKNKGKKHVPLKNITLDLFKRQGATIQKDSNYKYDLSTLISGATLLPGEEKTEIIPWPKDYPYGDIEGGLIFK